MLRDFVDRPRSFAANPQRRVEVKDSVSRYSWDFAPFEAFEGVTVSTVTAESSNTGAVTIGGDALASSTWTGYLTAVNQGRSRITLTAASSGTPVAVRYFIVEVVDPTLRDDPIGF